MFSTTDCDARYAAHMERVARIDRESWHKSTALAARPRLAWVGVLIARAGRLGWPTRRTGRVAAAPTGHGLS
jgi:hypothetical protein